MNRSELAAVLDGENPEEAGVSPRATGEDNYFDEDEDTIYLPEDDCPLLYASTLAEYDFAKRLCVRDHTKDPHQAILHEYCRGGDLRFLETQTFQGGPGYREGDRNNRLADAILREIPSTSNLQRRSDLFLRSMAFPRTTSNGQIAMSDINVCGCCGVDQIVTKDNPMPRINFGTPKIEHLRVQNTDKYSPTFNIPSRHFRFPDGTEAEIDYAKSPIHYTRTNRNRRDVKYWLHPQAVDEEEECVTLCKRCHHILPNKTPPFSLRFVNFGSMANVGIEDLTTIERMMVSTVRGYQMVLQIQSNALFMTDRTSNELRGHWIVFNADTPKVLARQLFTIEAWKKCVMIELVCPKGKKDWLLHKTRTSSHLRGDAKKLYTFLLLKKKLDPASYGNVNLPDFAIFREEVENLPGALIENALVTEDSFVAMAESTRGSDYANVRTTQVEQNQENGYSSSEEDNDANENIQTEGVYVHTERVFFDPDVARTDPQARAQKEAINAMNRMLNEPINCKSRRSITPINEFEMGDRLLVGLLPDLFLLGHAYGKKSGSLTLSQTTHLLSQCNKITSACDQLLPFLSDQKMRHSHVQSVVDLIKNSPDKLAALQNEINTSGFRLMLKKANEDSQSETAKMVLNQFGPILNMAGAKVKWGPMSTNAITAEIYAMCQFYGPPFGYGTLNTDDINNPTVFRLASHAVKNDIFPCHVGDDFLKALREQSIYVESSDVNIPTGFVHVLRKSKNSPIAVARMFKEFVENVCKEAFDIHLAHKGGASHRLYSYRKKVGVNGTTIGFYGVVECSSKGSLHIHFLYFGGVPPDIVSRFAHVKKVSSAMVAAFEAQFQTEIPAEYHCARIVNEVLHKNPRSRQHLDRRFAPLFHAPPRMDEDSGFENHYLRCASLHQVHNHNFTCFKGKMGYSGCRLCYKQARNNGTEIFQLQRSEENNAPEKLDNIVPPSEHLPSSNAPLRALDSRCIMLETSRRTISLVNDPTVGDDENIMETLLRRCPRHSNYFSTLLNSAEGKEKLRLLCYLIVECGGCSGEMTTDFLVHANLTTLLNIVEAIQEELPSANGSVVSFNNWITANLGCNSAIHPLGDRCQSVSSCFYLAPYFKKNKAQADRCLGTLYRVSQQFEHLHHSDQAQITEDSYDTKRFLQRVLNTLTTLSEFSDTQMAYFLIGGQPRICTDTFLYTDPRRMLEFSVYYNTGQKLKGYITTCKPKDCNNRSDSLFPGEADSAATVIGDGSTDYSANSAEATATIQGANFGETTAGEDWTDDEAEHADPYYGTSVIADMMSGELSDDEDNESPSEGREIDLGRVKAYVIDKEDNTKAFVLEHLNFRLRGKALRHFRPLEYYVHIHVRPKGYFSTKEEFYFDDSHPLYETHVQYLNHKPSIPILRGGAKRWRPLKYKANGVPTVSSLRARDAFGAYYVALLGNYSNCFSLEHNDENSYNYDGFLRLLGELRTNDTREQNVTNYLRLQRLHRMIFTMTVSQENKDMVMEYRGRDRDVWTKEEKSRREAMDRHQQNFVREMLQMTPDGQEHISTKTLRARIENIRRISFTEKILGELGHLTRPSILGSYKRNDRAGQATIVENSHPREEQRSGQFLFSEVSVGKVMKDVHEDMKVFAPPNNDLSSPARVMANNDNVGQYDAFSVYEDIVTRAINDYDVELNQKQKNVVMSVLNDLIHNYSYPNDKRSSLHLVIGYPGVGKSTISGCIEKAIGSLGIGKVLKTAYTGIAASIIGGVLFLSTFRIHTRKKKNGKTMTVFKTLTDNEMVELRASINASTLVLLMIDESSQFTTEWISILNNRFKQMMGNDLPFGGIAVVLMGDYMQMPPIGGQNTADSMMKYARMSGKHFNSDAVNLKINGSIHAYDGCRILSLFKCVKLDKIVRSISDPEYSRFTRDLARGESANVDRIISLIKPLSDQDFLHDPSWLMATYLVNTNHERIVFSYFLLKRYARYMKLPVVKWKTRVGVPKAKGTRKITVEELEMALELEEENPVFWTFFVPGVPGVILDNINTNLRLANGTRVIYDSLTFSTDSVAESVAERMKFASPGETITLSGNDEPTSINVRPVDPDSDRLCKPYSIVSDRTVIPLAKHTSSASFNCLVYTYNVDQKDAFLVATKEQFPVMPACSLTLDKSQGCTLDKVVVLLEKRQPDTLQPTFAKFLVGTSRVSGRDSIRAIYPKKLDGSICTKSLEYISKLKPLANVSAFLAGFADSDQPVYWDRKLAMANWGSKTKQKKKSSRGQKRSRGCNS